MGGSSKTRWSSIVLPVVLLVAVGGPLGVWGAPKELQGVIRALEGLPQYSRFLQAVNSGFVNGPLAKQIDEGPVVLLAPDDKAIKTLYEANGGIGFFTLAKLFRFHCLIANLDEAALRRSARVSPSYPTMNGDDKVQRRGTRPLRLIPASSNSASDAAKVITPALYESDSVKVFGISKVLIPSNVDLKQVAETPKKHSPHRKEHIVHQPSN